MKLFFARIIYNMVIQQAWSPILFFNNEILNLILIFGFFKEF